MNIPYQYIAIEGNIGAGKTTLAHMLSEEYNARLILEQFEDNSFLPKFYQSPEQYAFPLEMSFLADRYQQLKNDLQQGDLFSSFVVADYFLDKSLIFARKNLQDDEYQLYKRMYSFIHAALPKPDLIVYLWRDVDNLLKQIEKRGRSYEQNISAAYLKKIQNSYMDYFKSCTHCPVLILDVNALDFIKNPADYKIIKDRLQQQYSNGIHRVNLL